MPRRFLATSRRVFLRELVMIDWPEKVVADLARRRAVLVLGAGVSRQAVGQDGQVPPTWKKFLELANERCPGGRVEHVGSAISEGDLLHACEWLKNRFDEHWVDFLRETFHRPGFSPSQLHRLIVQLDSRLVFSLNFDDIYERAANEAEAGAHIVKNYNDGDIEEFLRGDGRYIVKVHGSLNSPNNLIFTQNEYSKARVKNSSFYHAFDAALMTHTFIFIGASYNDPDVNLILENQKFSFPTVRPHYMLTPHMTNKDLESSLRRNRNIKLLEYEKVDDSHSGLVSEVADLLERVELEREELTKNTNW